MGDERDSGHAKVRCGVTVAMAWTTKELPATSATSRPVRCGGCRGLCLPAFDEAFLGTVVYDLRVLLRVGGLVPSMPAAVRLLAPLLSPCGTLIRHSVGAVQQQIRIQESN